MLPAVEQILAVAGVPGISICIISHGRTSSTHHLGYRDYERRLRPDDRTRYNINSLSKCFLAALAAIENFNAPSGITWSDPIQKWLPDFRGSTQEVGTNTNVIDLLSHRTGIMGLDDLWMGADNAIYMPRSQALRTFASLKSAHSFRTAFEYNNWGYEIMGQLLEESTGHRLNELFQSRIFTPLNMTRTSTAWNTSDSNEAKSHGILHDFSIVDVQRPSLGSGTIMECVGGIKSSLEDLMHFYKTFMREMKAQHDQNTNSTKGSPLKYCQVLTSSHVQLEGTSFREQSYALGWVRAELPGQLGRVSANVGTGDEPIVGKGGSPRLVLYHHGCMPGSTSAVILIPELESGVVVLQNSMPVIDTADFVAQMLLEALLDTPEPNDYVHLAKDFYKTASSHLDTLRKELDENRIPGTRPRPLPEYEGRFWNQLRNFYIDVFRSQGNGQLTMRFQGLKSQAYTLKHYHYDMFLWLMPYDEIVRRDRGVPFYSADYYTVTFASSSPSGNIDELYWVHGWQFHYW